jgi:sugar lactone lactonase YvrE
VRRATLVGASVLWSSLLPAPSLAPPSGMRAQVVTAFESLSHGKMPSAATVQGFDAAMAHALQVASDNERADYAGLLGGVLRVSSVGLAAPGVADAHFTITNGQGTYKERLQFVGTAVPIDGTWRVSWVTMCMLVEEEGVVCPSPPAGAHATVPLPYSVTARRELAAQAPDLLRPQDLVALPDGSLLVADTNRDQILKWSPGGHVSVFAGTGQVGYSGDGGPAVDAELESVDGMALGRNGTLYFTDDNRLRAVSPAGTVTAIAGNGKPGSNCGKGDALDRGLSPGGVAVAPDGSLYVTDGTHEICQISPAGTISTFFKGSGARTYTVGTPEGRVAFLPARLAFAGSGDLVVFNLSPPEILSISPSGDLTLLGTGYATQLTTAPGGKVLLASRYGTVQEATKTGLTTLIDLNPPRIAGFGVPGQRPGFQADGIAAAPSGALYLDTDNTNGWSDVTALVRMGLGGKGEVLPIKTPLLATLPAVGAQGFPASVYPPALPSRGSDLPACPGTSGLKAFGPVAVEKALAEARELNSTRRSFYGDLRFTDRAWWPSLFGEWAWSGYERGPHAVDSHSLASHDIFSAAVAQACGKQLVRDSLVVVVGPSSYSSQVSHLYFLDRRGQPLVYFQAS